MGSNARSAAQEHHGLMFLVKATAFHGLGVFNALILCCWAQLRAGEQGLKVCTGQRLQHILCLEWQSAAPATSLLTAEIPIRAANDPPLITGMLACGCWR